MIAVASWLLAMVAAIPLIIYTVEVAAGLRRNAACLAASPACDIAILIPAHNEEAGIERTLAALRPLLPARARVIVVADNCSDGTAAKARAAGAIVHERFDPHRRGKGFALAFGRDCLLATEPEVVIVLDADCRFLPGSIEALAAQVSASGRPAQACNTLEPDLLAPPGVQISNFAMIVKNVVRSRGMARLGGASLLTGTGMAFPWSVFSRASLATDSIVEDLALGIELTRRGLGPRLAHGAAVRSPAAHESDMIEQRSRWERGFLAVARRSALPALWEGVAKESRALALLGLHLLVPPLAMLFSVSCAVILLLGFAALVVAKAAAGPAAFLFCALLAAAAATVAAWAREGRDTLAPAALLRVPAYMAQKLPMYLSFAKSKKPEWTRARRR